MIFLIQQKAKEQKKMIKFMYSEKVRKFEQISYSLIIT